MSGFSIVLILKEIMTFQKIYAFCYTKMSTLRKTKCNRKWKIPPTVLDRRNLCFNSYENRKLKIKLSRVWTRERKKRAFFIPLTLFKEFFFHICLLPQWITYWIYFQNIHTFSHQKSLLHTHFCLFLKSWKAFCDFLRTEMFIAFFVRYKKRLTEIKMIRHLGCSIFLTLQRKVTFLAPTTNLEGLKTKFLIHFLFQRTLIAAVKAIHALYWIDSSFWYSFL